MNYEPQTKQINISMKFSLLLSALLIGAAAIAQDTTKKRAVTVTSTFKPVLKEAAKINFNATPPFSDTSTPRLQYDIPNQNLVLGYQPGLLKPLALQVDTGGAWDNSSYVKVGYGTLQTPYVQAGFTVGDPRTAGLNLYTQHISSKGKREFQDFKNSNVELNGFYKMNNMQLNARFGGKIEDYYKYGFQPDDLSFKDDSLKLQYKTVRTRLAAHNIAYTDLGISYAPELKFDAFNDRLNNAETNMYFNVPLRKTIGETFSVDIALSGDLTRYKTKGKGTITNNFFSLAPSVSFRKSYLNIQAGINPSWDEKGAKIFPNVIAEVGSAENGFAVQLGWVGYMRKNSYQYLAGYNPWIWAPNEITSSRIEEIYGGIKGSLTDHFAYSGKVGLNKYTNQPLFVNDRFDGKSFEVLIEPEMRALNVSGQVGYNVGEKFSLTSSLNINKFMNLDENKKAWGLIPVEFKTAMRIQVLKDLYVKTDLYSFGGQRYRTSSGDNRKGESAMDLSAGLEFGIVKNVKLWAQFNNILNKEYQRWNQYPVYGFNFLGGVVFSFTQNTK
jgi:hypothetical protein